MSDPLNGGPGSPAAETEGASSQPGGERPAIQGSTSIADAVVSKIAGIAAGEVTGVHALGGGTARAFGVIREKIPGSTAAASQGVSVEVGDRKVTVDLDIVIEYGITIPDLALAIRENVVRAVEKMTALTVTEVNISVDDVHLPDDPDEESVPAAEDATTN